MFTGTDKLELDFSNGAFDSTFDFSNGAGIASSSLSSHPQSSLPPPRHNHPHLSILLPCLVQ